VKKRSLGNLPTQVQLFRAVLEVGLKYPAGNFTAAWYRECKLFFPELTKEDYAQTTGGNEENAWKLQIRFAKKKLEYDYKYMIANLPTGFWRISNAGAKALLEMRDGTWKQPASRKETTQPK
jgi:hypothetical protein